VGAALKIFCFEVLCKPAAMAEPTLVPIKISNITPSPQAL
jgi:hypothetical protein